MISHKKQLVITGSARSGTSWFSETIAAQHRYRILFEPEHEFNTKNGKLICDRYLDENLSTLAIDNYLKRIFTNSVDCDWIAQLSNRKFKRHLWPFIPKRIIVKFVRCNLAANYIAGHFKIPVIFILRNPYDVIMSQKRVNFPWLYDLSWFKNQDHLCRMIKDTYGYDLREDKKLSAIEKLSLRWCIENSVPFLNDSVHFRVLKYESIKEDVNLFLDICRAYNLDPVSDILEVFKQPSSKTHAKSNIITGKKNESRLSPEEYDILNSYLDMFAIDVYQREH